MTWLKLPRCSCNLILATIYQNTYAKNMANSEVFLSEGGSSCVFNVLKLRELSLKCIAFCCLRHFCIQIVQSKMFLLLCRYSRVVNYVTFCLDYSRSVFVNFDSSWHISSLHNALFILDCLRRYWFQPLWPLSMAVDLFVILLASLMDSQVP